MQFNQIMVTPAIAQGYLNHNTANRPFSEKVVRRYASEMIAGRWKPDTGEVIKISKTGLLLDGQHRLAAIIKSEKPILLHVATEINEDVFDVLDTGKKRSTSDVFGIKGINNSYTLPSIILSNLEIIKGNRISEKPSSTLALEIYFQQEKFWDFVTTSALKYYKRFSKLLPTSVIGGMFSIFYKLSPNEAEDFFDQLTTGAHITNNSILALRQKLLENRLSIKKLEPSQINAYIIKTWNAFRKKDEIKILRFSEVKEDFPKAI